MHYANLCPAGSRADNWVIFQYTKDDRVVLRERYAACKCPACPKVDEAAALRLGVESSFRVKGTQKGKCDFLMSNEGYVLISTRLRDLFKAEGVGGFETVALPGDPGYVIAWPTLAVPTNRERAGIKTRGEPCPVCRRVTETTGTPPLNSLTLPDDPRLLFVSDIPGEKSRWMMTWFYASPLVCKLMKAAKITGVEYMKVWAGEGPA